MADFINNPILLAEDVGIASLGIWFMEYFFVPVGLWNIWPNKMSLAITEGALSVLLFNWAMGVGGGWTDWLIGALAGGILGYYVIYWLKGDTIQ